MRPLVALAVLLLVTPVALAQSAPTLAPALAFDPSTGTMHDQTGGGNEGTLLHFDSTTDGLRDGVLRFDGVDDLVETTLVLTAPSNLTLDITFRTTTPGGLIMGFASERNATDGGGGYDRAVYVTDDGRVRFAIWDGRAENVSSLAPVTDGAMHEVVATLAPNGTGNSARITLSLDGVLQQGRDVVMPPTYGGYWRLGGGSFQRWVGAPANAFYQGDVGAVRVYSAAFAAPARLHSPGPGDALAFEPQASPLDITGAVVTGVAVATATAVLAARGFDLFAFLKKTFLGSLADKWRDRTKRFLAWQPSSWIAGAVGLVLMVLLVAAGTAGAQGFAWALLVAGLASLVFKAGVVLSGALLACAGRLEPRYRLWSAGAFTLAVTSLFFHAPFGYTGYLDRVGRVERGRGEAAVHAAAGIGVAAVLALVFYSVGVLWHVAFWPVGMTLALGALASASLPFPTLAGNTVWRWSKPAAVVLALAGVAPYVLYEAGRFPPSAVVALGVAGIMAFAAAFTMEKDRTAGSD